MDADNATYAAVLHWLDANRLAEVPANKLAKTLGFPVHETRNALYFGIRAKRIGEVYRNGVWLYRWVAP